MELVDVPLREKLVELASWEEVEATSVAVVPPLFTALVPRLQEARAPVIRKATDRIFNLELFIVNVFSVSIPPLRRVGAKPHGQDENVSMERQ